MKTIASLFIFLFFIPNQTIPYYHQSDCNSIPAKFQSFKAATNAIENSTFKLEDHFIEENDSWFKWAKFYSFNGQTSYMIYGTEKRKYIHKNIPFKMWKELKNSTSRGKYYNKFIKGKYRLLL